MFLSCLPSILHVTLPVLVVDVIIDDVVVLLTSDLFVAAVVISGGDVVVQSAVRHIVGSC